MSADLIARLIEAGTPATLVAEVALALGRAAGDQDVLAARRAADAERQRVKRAAEKASRDITLGHGTSRDTSDAPPSSDKETLSPTPPIKEIKSTPVPARRGSATGYHRRPADWQPAAGRVAPIRIEVRQRHTLEQWQVALAKSCTEPRRK